MTFNKENIPPRLRKGEAQFKDPATLRALDDLDAVDSLADLRALEGHSKEQRR